MLASFEVFKFNFHKFITKIKSQLLEAAFTGNEDKLIKILKSLQKQNHISDNLIIECIEYSSKHSNTEIASISSQILSPSPPIFEFNFKSYDSSNFMGIAFVD